MHRFAVTPTQMGVGMNRAFGAGGLALHKSSPRRAAYERRAFGANRFVQVKSWTNVPGFWTQKLEAVGQMWRCTFLFFWRLERTGTSVTLWTGDIGYTFCSPLREFWRA